MMSKNTRKRHLEFYVHQLFGLMILALCMFSSGAAQSDSTVWFSDRQNVYQVDPADQRVLREIPVAEVNNLAADANGGVWLSYGSYIGYYSTSNHVPQIWGIDAFGLRAVRHLRVDPYNASVWLGDGRRVVHLAADGRGIANIAIPTSEEDISLALDGSVWVLESGGPLRHYDPQGTALGNLAIPDSMREGGKHFAIDSIRQKIWMWNDGQLLQLDINTGAQQRSFSLPAGTVSTALDQRTGTLWTMSATALTAHTATGFPQATALNILDIADPRALTYDSGNDCLWVGHSKGISRLDFSRQAPATLIAATPALHIDAIPFAPSPVLSLLAPASNHIAADVGTTFVLGVDALCAGKTCRFSGDDLKNYRIEAMLGQRSVGEQFVFDANSRTFRYTPVLPASGQVSLLAQAIDPFGHASNVVNETFELDGGVGLGGSSPNVTAAAHSPPTVSITSPLNNASINGPLTVTITANAAAVGATVSKVAFYNGTTLLGTVTASPYTYKWANVAAGTYTLTAKATDSLGFTTTSAAVKFGTDLLHLFQPVRLEAKPVQHPTHTPQDNYYAEFEAVFGPPQAQIVIKPAGPVQAHLCAALRPLGRAAGSCHTGANHGQVRLFRAHAPCWVSSALHRAKGQRVPGDGEDCRDRDLA